MRMDEEDLVKEKVRCKQKEDEVSKRMREDSKKISEMTRTEKNKAWRMRKEQEVPETNWRNVEERVHSELNCPCCGIEMAPPLRIYQCRDGHVVCEECWDQRNVKVCPKCKEPISGRNVAMERISSIFFNSSSSSDLHRKSFDKTSTRSSSTFESSAPPSEKL